VNRGSTVLTVHGSWHFIYETIVFGTWGSSVTIVTRLRASRSEVIILPGAKFFSLLQNIQSCSGAHPSSCAMGTGVLSRVQGNVDHSPSSGAEVTNEWSHTSVAPICCYGMGRETFTSWCDI
jgi:hypothetical protein